MRRLISFTTAGRLMLYLLLALVLFHFGVLTGLVPTDIVWAGRFTDQAELVRMESFSVLLLAVIIGVVLARVGFLGSAARRSGWVRAAMWVVGGLFVLNTLGNFTAVHPLERYGFGLLTIVLALLAFRLAIEKTA
jgi:hypothetical protein